MGYENGTVSAQEKQPLVSFGVIADVQYAAIPDGRSFLGVPRYYRHSLLVLQRAVQDWNEKKVVVNTVGVEAKLPGLWPEKEGLAEIGRKVESLAFGEDAAEEGIQSQSG